MGDAGGSGRKKNTQPKKNVSAVTSWPWNSAARTLQSLETPPGPCLASCPGGLPLGSGQAPCSCPLRKQGALPCQSPALGSRRHLAPCSAHRSGQSRGLPPASGGAGRPGCRGSQWKRTMLRKRRPRKTGRSWTGGRGPPPWSPVSRSCVSGRCNGVGVAAWPSSARGGGERVSGDAGP